MDKKTAIVIGSGGGGAVIANELQGEYQVTVLEKGGDFEPCKVNLLKLAKLRKTELMFDERMVTALVHNMHIRRTKDISLVYGVGVGGTTTLATGNAARYDSSLKEIGIDLDEEFSELNEEVPITTDHRKYWPKVTQTMFETFESMGLDPQPTPKFLFPDKKCVNCGRCAIGCLPNVKWDNRQLIDSAVKKGAKLVTNCKVTKLVIGNGRVTSVKAVQNGLPKTFKADVIILAAGGLATPVILEKSGIACQQNFWADPYISVGGYIPGFGQDKQMLMPFFSRQDGYILSPYMDYQSFFFTRKWRYPMKDIVSIMIKMADEETGSVKPGHIQKNLTEKDRATFEKAIAQCREILLKLGVKEEDIFLGPVGAAHPGGSLPLTSLEKDTLHNSVLPENLYIGDATLLPQSMGFPPLLTIMALAKKVSKVIKAQN